MMRAVLQKITNTYKSEEVQKIWKDPVWSKVIAGAIVGLVSLIFSLIYTIINKTNLSYITPAIDSVIADTFSRLFVKVLMVVVLFSVLAFCIYKRIAKYWSLKLVANESDTTIPLLTEHPAIVFDTRIGKSFPGLHRNVITWFDKPRDAAYRLELLLKKPIEYRHIDDEGDTGIVHIFWWYRDTSNMFISKFEIIEGSKCLMDGYYEMNIKQIAVFRSHKKQLSFIYVETDEMSSTGLYNDEHRQNSLNENGYYQEAYALLGKRKISINDYNDGSTLVKGKVVSTQDAILRLRMVSKYNFIITSPLSPYDDKDFDLGSDVYLRPLLFGENNYNSLWTYMSSFRQDYKYSRREDPYRDMLY